MTRPDPLCHLASVGSPGRDEDGLIRFVTSARHPPYGHRTGVVQAAYALLREERLRAPDRVELRCLLDWFDEHLHAPERLSVSRHPRAKGSAISWLRASAEAHVHHLCRLAALIERAGTRVEALRTTRPGYIVYEDSHQVVALPFADTPR